MDTRKTHQLVDSHLRPNQGLGIEPATQVRALDRESHLPPFGPCADALTTERNWPGPNFY